MKVRQLRIDLGRVNEIIYDKPEPGDNEIEVKALMTGICRSDIDMMRGCFGPLPAHMHGHEGLGQITKIGKNLQGLVQIGQYVATRGEPAYADFYNVRQQEFVIVPEVHPKYIIEPVACGVNLIEQDWTAIQKRINKRGSRIAFYGSGFLSFVAYNTLKNNLRTLSYEIEQSITIDVIGNSNKNLWAETGVELKSKLNGQYDVILDLKDDQAVWSGDYSTNNSIIIAAVEKELNFNLGPLLWRATTIICPSPRTESFYYSMLQARDLVRSGQIKIDNFWTNGYNRENAWQQAFEDSLNRTVGFSRAYIYW